MLLWWCFTVFYKYWRNVFWCIAVQRHCSLSHGYCCTINFASRWWDEQCIATAMSCIEELHKLLRLKICTLPVYIFVVIACAFVSTLEPSHWVGGDWCHVKCISQHRQETGKITLAKYSGEGYQLAPFILFIFAFPSWYTFVSGINYCRYFNHVLKTQLVISIILC